MNIRLVSCRLGLPVAALCLGALLPPNADAAGRPRGRPIHEFAVPGSSEIATNLHELTNKKDGLQQLEEDLHKPFQSLAPKSSLDGVVARPPKPPARPAIDSKKVKELLERRRDWVFMTPEDLLAVPTVDEILKTPPFEPEGYEKQDLPALQRFYQRLATKPSEIQSPTQPVTSDLFTPPKELGPSEQQPEREEMNLPGGLRESAEALNRLFDPAHSDSPLAGRVSRGTLTDIFGLGEQSLTEQQVQDRKKLMDQYRSMVDPSWKPAATSMPVSPLTAMADVAGPASTPAVTSPGLPKTAPRTALEAQYDVKYPRLGPPDLPDVNARALGQTRPSPPLPTAESTRILPPPPTFAAPNRSFR